MSSVLSTEVIASLTAKFADLPAERVAEIAEAAFKAQPTQKPRRKAKEIPAEERCKARMWCQDTHDEEGNYIYGTPSQCSRRHKDGRFCAQHVKAHVECSQPLQFTHTHAKDYKRHGLFHGAMDEELPIHDAEGRLVIFWNDPAAKAWVQEQKASGSYTEHPAWPSAGGNIWLGGNGEKHGSKKGEGTKSTKKKKAKGTVASAIGVKQKRGLSPYFCFLANHRETIKGDLEAAEAAAAVDEGRSPITIRIGPVTKEAGVRWAALKEAVDKNEPAAVAEMASCVASSAASKAQAAEANAAAEKAAVGSLDDQIAALQAQKAAAAFAASASPVEVPAPSLTLSPPASMKKLKVKTPAPSATAPAPPPTAPATAPTSPIAAPTPAPAPTAPATAPASPTPTPTSPVAAPPSPTEEEEDSDDDYDEEEADGTAEEFNHEGQDLWKMEQSDGSFRILIADKEGDGYYDWGTMTAAGVVTKTYEE